MRYYLVIHKMHGPKIRYGARADVFASETAHAGGMAPLYVVPVLRSRVDGLKQAIRLGVWGRALLREAGAI